MSRPKDADPKETRQRILSSACDLLAADSSNFSLRAVARGADVSIGTLQYHFADKQTLEDACIDTVYDTFRGLATTLGAKLAESASKEQLIAGAVSFGFAYARANQPFIRILEASIVKNGGLDLSRNSSTQQPFLTGAGRLAAADLDLPLHEVQLRLNSMVMLVGRYSVLSEESMAVLFEAQPGKSVVETVEAHLISMAKLLLLPTK